MFFICKLMFLTSMFCYGRSLCVREGGTTIITYFTPIFSKHSFFAVFAPDFLETLSHDVCSSAIENLSSQFLRAPVKEIRARNPHFWPFFRTPH